ncbi:winged helix-turn-helix domain-containing protein [Burkholderia sp. A1]|uniref:winged helix-turn-helix domain-containing protein n=1 Tax=Burkholderia sp. A1 TaxID=148446 RepID=UPI00046A5D9B|nr:winged helix-turn-helix domain-containing protein [Burkholderia sp. A1]
MKTVSQSAFASMCGVSRQMVSKWKSAGWIVLQGAAVDVEATHARMKTYYSKGSPVPASVLSTVDTGVSSVDKPMSTAPHSVNQEPDAKTAGERLASLDGTIGFEFSREALRLRIDKAARILGWRVQFEDDGIRLSKGDLDPMTLDDDPFEINAYVALETLRFFGLDPDAPLAPKFAPALPLLAKPFGTPDTEQACNVE